MVSHASEAFTVIGDKRAVRGNSPTKVYLSVKTAEQQSMFYTAFYESEHLGAMIFASARIGKIHEEPPDFFAEETPPPSGAIGTHGVPIRYLHRGGDSIYTESVRRRRFLWANQTICNNRYGLKFITGDKPYLRDF